MRKPKRLTSADFVLLFVACCYKLPSSAEAKEPIIMAKELREGTKYPLPVTALRVGSTVSVCCEFKGEPRKENDGSFGEIQLFIFNSKAVSMTGKLKRYRTKLCTRLVVKTNVTVKCGGRCRGEDGNEAQLKGEKKLTAFELTKPTLSFKGKIKVLKTGSTKQMDCWTCSTKSSVAKTEMYFKFVGQNVDALPKSSCPGCEQKQAGGKYTVTAEVCPRVLKPGLGIIECRVAHASSRANYLFAQTNFTATGKPVQLSAYSGGGTTAVVVWSVTGLAVLVMIALGIFFLAMLRKRQKAPGEKGAGQAVLPAAGNQVSKEGSTSQVSKEGSTSQVSKEGPSASQASGSGSKSETSAAESSTGQSTSEA